MDQGMSVGGVLAMICTLPPRVRDGDDVRAFVMTLPRGQGLRATDSQVEEARRIVETYFNA